LVSRLSASSHTRDDVACVHGVAFGAKSQFPVSTKDEKNFFIANMAMERKSLL